ncbi:MAG: Beta-barrel assembly-enhancing protease [Gammaproteobacteria bacterium]|nr:Beta-barrel assembly-enhancing protease [Gammaproteobacteria bacterium]
MNRLLTAALLWLCLVSPAWAQTARCEAEVRRAATTLGQIHRQWPLRPTGDRVEQGAQYVAARLGRYTAGSGRIWRVHIVRDSKLNAFSIGDGHIFLTEGMLRFVANEGELAAVIAHEFGHHLAGHFCTSARKRGFWGGLFGGSGEENATRSRVGALTAIVDPEKEREADRIATIVLDRAGYDPRHALELAMRMAHSGSAAHFQYRHRVEALQELLAGRPRASRAPADSQEFREMKRTLWQEEALR